MDTETKDFGELCADVRTDLKAFYPRLKALIVLAQESTPTAVADGESLVDAQEEMAANITLALRHLEDASMRVGKGIQAFNGGKSPLDGTMGSGAAAAPAAAAQADDTSAAQKDSTNASADTSADAGASADTTA